MSEKQFIIFELGEETYGADISKIREIIKPVQPTKVPNNPEFIEGVIDVRGQVVPLLDLKKRFHLGEGEYGANSKIMVAGQEGDLIGYLVDDVTEIISMTEEELSPAPDVTKIGKEYIQGVTKKDDRLLILLDMNKVLSVDEKEVLDDLR
ncbi:MAG: chemotaxis protein CheW [Clostridia bacterium]|nr:chemotaxis protein CheW [Clostridia bacterium]